MLTQQLNLERKLPFENADMLQIKINSVQSNNFKNLTEILV